MFAVKIQRDFCLICNILRGKKTFVVYVVEHTKQQVLFLPSAFLKFILASTVLYSFQNNFTNIFFFDAPLSETGRTYFGLIVPKGNDDQC